jgi:hypothetical protein
MVAALKALNAEVKYTEYSGVAHFMWDQAYAEPGLPEWLFSKQKTSGPSTLPHAQRQVQPVHDGH